MFRIGELAQLSQVTVQTLRYYDELGLIKPVHTDPDTNYRYYSMDQLPHIHRIMALKEIGFSLEQIKLMLGEELPAEQLRGMLRLKRNEALQQMEEVRRQLALIEFRLNMIDSEAAFPNLDVVIKRLEPLRCLSYFVPPLHPTQRDAMLHMKLTVKALNEAIAAGLIEHTGVTIDVFHGDTILPFESPEIEENQHEILLGVAEKQGDVDLDGIGYWTIKEEPEVATAATLMVAGQTGEDMGLVEKATLLRHWAINHGYKPFGFVRYLHHRGTLQTMNLDELLLEVQIPVAPAD
jgi:DNA-binding transcriptional MerR regulator